MDLKKHIKVGPITLTLKKNREAFYRYEGFIGEARMLIRQDPWGTWSGCIVLKDAKGSMVNGHSMQTPDEVGNLLLQRAEIFYQALGAVLGKVEALTVGGK
jgi:hypothetical protein